jgi:hypothetical protein
MSNDHHIAAHANSSPSAAWTLADLARYEALQALLYLYLVADISPPAIMFMAATGALDS